MRRYSRFIEPEAGIEYQNGAYWVRKIRSTNPNIAIRGTIYYEVFKEGLYYSTSTGYLTSDRQRAINYCDKYAAEETK